MGEKYRLPWHRIIRADGSIALESCHGREIQIELLRAEGVKVSTSGRVDMGRYGFAWEDTARDAPSPEPGPAGEGVRNP
jgi:methylated-DNA-protein-cysteine methyltransferase-like protein